LKVLVTGASGRLGQFVRTKIQRRSDVQATYLVSPRAPVRSEADVRVDFTDARTLADVIASVQPDAIVHLAGINGADCDRDLTLAREVNVNAVRVLSDSANRAGTSRIVFASSASVYGDRHSYPLNEESLLDLGSSYAEMKFEAEEILQADSDAEDGRSSIALRIFNIYGESFSNSLVCRLLDSDEHKPVLLRGLDTFVRDYVHANDVATAILAAVEVTATQSHTTFNIGSGVATTNRQLLERLSARRRVYYDLAAEIDSYSCADISAARDRLHFVPEYLL
jgi:UDP-glucose 4-epimerase